MIKLGILMDPIEEIKVYKDTSFAMLLEAQRRDWQSYYIRPHDIWLQDGITWGRMSAIHVKDSETNWFDLEDTIEQPLVECDVLLMRKDPPFNMRYIHLTYLLEQAEAQGLLVLNKPSSLRDANEKLFTSWFPQCCPKTLISSYIELLKEFIANEKDVVVKPLDGMGGASVFRVGQNDPNKNVILETMTKNENRFVMAQRFIPEIEKGDKRIILIDGEPVPHLLARVPAADDFRGNLASGAIGEGRELSDRDYWICQQVGPTLREKGLLFVGLDVIGDYLTEINVTSPTGIREIDRIFNINIAGRFFDMIEQKLQ